MIKIKYPSDTRQFHQDYIDIFDSIDLTQKFCGKSIKELLIMPIDEIVNFKITNIGSNYYDDKKNIFNYDSYQKKIAQFFMKYQDELNLSTCYFCNINHIYSFKNEYCNTLDFILYASKSELEQVKLIANATSKKIIKFRTENDIMKFDDIPSNILTSARKQNIINKIEAQYNHFTLDHLIEKSSHPLFALSLYNLIPSCSVCNSKFKHTISLVEDTIDLKFIPSYKDSKLNEDVKFKLYFDDECEEEINIDLDKIKIVLKSDDRVYRKYISTFKLYSRYQNHTHIVENIIQKSKKYSDTKLKQMAKITGKSVSEIKRDIFGDEVFDDNIGDVPLGKLKRDVYEKIGVLI